MPDNYLVIGGEGFLGRSIVDHLLRRNETSVSTFDIQQRYFDEAVTHYTGDLTDLDSIADAIRKSSATIVIHTASPPHNLGPEIYWRVNVQGTKNVIEACLADGVRKLVFTSSASVIYNGSDLRNADETFPYPDVHMDAYNETKVRRTGTRLTCN